MTKYRNQVKQQDFIKSLYKAKDISEVDEIIVNISPENIIDFFEKAIIKQISGKRIESGEKLFIDLAKRYKWFNKIPVQNTLINEILDKSTNEGKIKPFISKKMSVEDVKKIKYDQKGDKYVIVHNIYNKVSTSALTSYSSGSEMFRINGDIRIMSIGDKSFRNVSMIEDIAYRMVMTKIKTQEIFNYYQKYDKSSFGVFYHPFGREIEFRIIDLTGINIVKRKKKKSIDVREIPEGKRCRSYNNADLINIMFNLKIEFPSVAKILGWNIKKTMDDVKQVIEKIKDMKLVKKKQFLLKSKAKFKKYHLQNMTDMNIDYGLIWSYSVIDNKLQMRKTFDSVKITSELFCIFLTKYYISKNMVYHYA
jgi:hypothetical protein